jgi:protein-arginine kinase activator protein McsA
MHRRFCESCGKGQAEFIVCRASDAGGRTEQYLCEACARDAEHVMFGVSGLPMTDLLRALVVERPGSEIEQTRTKVCPGCGNTIDEVTESAMVGCAMCYSVFRNEIDRIVQEMHGHSFGQGKPA